MKKNKRTNIIILGISLIIIGSIISYNYSVEQTKQQGLQFGNDLKKIQDDVKQIQIEFNSRITQWEEGELTKKELLDYAESHFDALENTLLNYDDLKPPESFSSSVELFKMSTQAQFESDREMIEWIKYAQEENKIRSDSLIQESFEYEMMALGEFNAAKMGIKEYDVQEQFTPPKTDMRERVIELSKVMADRCQSVYIETGSNNKTDLEKCLNDSEEWKINHLR